MSSLLLNFELLVVNDYSPDIWTAEHVQWLQNYVDACCRYWKQQLDVDVIISVQCNEHTYYPKSYVSGAVNYTTMDDLKDLADTVRINRGDGICMLSRNLAYYQLESPPDKIPMGMSYPPDGWSHVAFNLPFIPSQTAFFNNLVTLSHELLHLVIWYLYKAAGKPFETSALDRAPYRTGVKYTTVYFEEKYIMQSLNL